MGTLAFLRAHFFRLEFERVEVQAFVISCHQLLRDAVSACLQMAEVLNRRL